MIDRDELRRKKIAERDRYVQMLHKEKPELGEIASEIGNLSLQLIKVGILHKNVEQKEIIDLKVQGLMARRKQILAQMGLDENVYEPKWDCPICKDLGYVVAGVECECLKKERIEKLKEDSTINASLQGKTFANFMPDYYVNQAKMSEIIDLCKAFAIKVIKGEPCGNLVLLGDVGRGKTHLSLAISNMVLDNAKSVYYTRVDELLEMVRKVKFDGAEDGKLKLAKECKLLVLDDFGAENVMSDFGLNQLRIILEERNLNNFSWIINTNLDLNGIEKQYGARVCDRILEKARIFKLDSNESIRVRLRHNEF